ncbi:PEP-utilizing enzyme [Candidatus Syntrophocurvum alkaliphilum]|uniref:PEP-utilizing enzyme n=1 Tax=Candidatus Syntrophocurvum alkaliphilum TaxID=2293317 RepID=UPI00168C2F14|nr:PEP-utilizing enzyme [Candidatus Syntrophocurvum alkaliphilum]
MAVVDTGEEGLHRREYNITISEGKKAAEELVREVEAKHGKVKGKMVKRLVRVLRNVMPVREHPKYLAMGLLYICKKAILEEANILVSKGQLNYQQDVFYLKLSEIYNAVKKDECLKEVVASRKEEYSHFQKLNPPRLMTSNGEEIKASYKREDLPEKALAGMPVSSGVVEGIAKVIQNPTKASVNKGEILVAPFTDPGWTPLFINAAALVMEVGGLLTHGTVVAREYGIPAVVGIVDATKKIKTGQKIRVDGNAGYVLVIEDQSIE